MRVSFERPETVVIKIGIKGRTKFEKVKDALNVLPSGIDDQSIIELASEICQVTPADLLEVVAGERIAYDFSADVVRTVDREIVYVGSWTEKLVKTVDIGDVITFGGVSYNVDRVDQLTNTIIVQHPYQCDNRLIITHNVLQMNSGYSVDYVKIISG